MSGKTCSIIYTHNESSLLEKQEGKIHLCILYTSYYWLTNFKVLPLHFALLSKFFLPPLLLFFLTHGGSRQLPFLLNVYHKVTHTYNVQNWAWTLLLLLLTHVKYVPSLSYNILYWMWSQIYYVNIVKNTPFFW